MNQFNLLPWRERREVRWQRQRYVLFGVIVLLALLAGYFTNAALMRRLVEQQTRNTEWQAVLATHQYEMQELQQISREKTQLAENMQALQRIQQSETQQQLALMALAQHLPQQIQLTQLQHDNRNWSFEGVCEDVAVLLAWLPTLQRIPELGSAHLETLREQNAPTKAHSFRVSLRPQELMP